MPNVLQNMGIQNSLGVLKSIVYIETKHYAFTLLDDGSFGISDGRVPDNCLFSSSVLNQSCGANQARLHKQPYKEKYGAWTPMYSDKNQYLDIDLGK